MELEKFIIEKAKEMANEMYDETEGEYVGAQMEDTFSFKNKTYKIIVDAFWEGSKHFDYIVEGIEYKKIDNSIMF